MDRKELALSLFQSGFNCAQSVLSAFAEDLEMDPDGAKRLCEGFGGTACNGAMPCGALLGAVMAIGLYAGRMDPEDMEAKLRTERLRKKITAGFQERFGAADCRSLLQWDITTPEGYASARSAGALGRCPEFVAGAVELLDDLLLNDGGQT